MYSMNKLVGIFSLAVLLQTPMYFAFAGSAEDPNKSMREVAQAKTDKFDGDWVGKLRKNFGRCRGEYSLNFNVTNGELSGTLSGNQGGYILSGTIASDGKLMDGMLDGGDTVTLKGTFSDDQAEGQWDTLSGCDGKFMFTRSAGS